MLALVFATGCGDSENDKFVSKANDTCRAAQKKIKAASGNANALISAGEAFVAKLRAIDPPEDKRDTYRRWVATQQKFFSELEAALRAKDQSRINALDEKTGDKLADELGLDSCKG